MATTREEQLVLAIHALALLEAAALLSDCYDYSPQECLSKLLLRAKHKAEATTNKALSKVVETMLEAAAINPPDEAS